MAERTNARLLKSRETSVSVGSNPTPSAGQSSQTTTTYDLHGRVAGVTGGADAEVVCDYDANENVICLAYPVAGTMVAGTMVAGTDGTSTPGTGVGTCGYDPSGSSAIGWRARPSGSYVLDVGLFGTAGGIELDCGTARGGHAGVRPRSRRPVGAS